MRILVVSDAWYPQVNGVVRTLETVGETLRRQGHEFVVIGPDKFRTIPCPSYPEIRLSIDAMFKLPVYIDYCAPDAIHISTEGPLGFSARNYCVRRRLPFTTAYHTRFPEYIHARTGFPLRWSYSALRWFHSPASRVMVATQSIENDLKARGFTNIVRWSRGVDTELFRPRDKAFLTDARPIALYVGRVAIEKNIEAFLKMPFEGTKLVVGDGPQLPSLQKRYPHVRFVGVKKGEELASYYAASDVFVFPSRTDTFGLVMLEALASGLPVAAFPVPGPIDVINGANVGCLSEELSRATEHAMAIPGATCREYALRYSWENAAQQFFENLSPVR